MREIEGGVKLGRYLKINEGDRIVLLEDISEGAFRFSTFDNGRIVYVRNQVEADVWLYFDHNNFKEVMGENYLPTDRIRGLVINLPRSKFGVKYHPKDHSNIQIRDEEAFSLPFFKEKYIEKLPALWYRGNEKGCEFKLSDVVDVIDSEFEKWVYANLNFRRILKREKEDGYYPEGCDRCLTDDSASKYYEARNDLEMKFAKVTGVYKEFYGGLIFD